VNKKVAIIMPYYNERDLLVASVQSILNQTYTNWHLYLIDDGSAKGNRAHEVQWTPELISKATICYKPNGGVSRARNAAIGLINADAGGFYERTIDYIAYCDSDDVWDPNYLEEQVKALANADFVYSSVRHKFLDGNIAVPYGIEDYPVYPGLDTLLKGNFIFISGVVHKQNIMSGNFDASLNSIEGLLG
jgi:teichuronic acid biosynthesis glycosyltransferase TuaG